MTFIYTAGHGWGIICDLDVNWNVLHSWYNFTYPPHTHTHVQQQILANMCWVQHKRLIVTQQWGHNRTEWASYQIRKIAGAHAPEMLGTFSPPPQVSDRDMHHGTCVTHVPWCKCLWVKSFCNYLIVCIDFFVNKCFACQGVYSKINIKLLEESC